MSYFARMFGLLHQYLVENRALYLRGTGQLQLIHQPASFDVAHQLLNAPRDTVQLKTSQQAGSLQPLIAFLSRQLDIAEENAFSLYESFCNQLQQDIESFQQVTWDHLGVFKKNQKGHTIFIPDPVFAEYNEALPAKRVIRQEASHTITVGNLETTNTELLETLSEPQEVVPKIRWGLAASILGIISIVLIILKKMNYL